MSDEGFWPIDRPKPLIRLRFAKPPSPTRGEGKSARLILLVEMAKKTPPVEQAAKYAAVAMDSRPFAGRY